MKAFTEIISFLTTIKYKEYRESKLPNLLDDEFAKLCEIYKATDLNDRVRLSTMLQERDLRQLLLEYVFRISMQSVRTNSQSLLINGLVALGMMPTRTDLDYDDYIALALVYHSAKKFGNPNQLFTEAATYITDADAKSFIVHFLSRTPNDQRIEAFGYHEVRGSNGVIYQYANHAIPKGLL